MILELSVERYIEIRESGETVIFKSLKVGENLQIWWDSVEGAHIFPLCLCPSRSVQTDCVRGVALVVYWDQITEGLIYHTEEFVVHPLGCGRAFEAF